MTTRKNIMLGTAGHVDHGKTALVKLLTGCDTDTLADEKKRGLTIDLGFAPCQMADERIVGVVDVPGHVGFIRNMVAGAQGVDVVIFVVAADDGVMPQTREHLDILTLMGVRRGIIALTKTDLVDAEMRELAAEDVREFVAGTFLENAPLCPISNITGDGFDEFFESLNAAVAACAGRGLSGLFRMWAERVFTIHGFGTVVSGIPSAGEVRVGDRLTIPGAAQTARLRKLQVYGQDAEVGRAGECVAMNLSDVDMDAIGRGMLLTGGDAFEPATMVEAELTILPTMAGPVADYVEGHIHVGTAEVMANVAMLEGGPIAPGESQLVQLRMRDPLALAPGERFVMRASLAGVAGGRVTTVGGGRILDTSDRRLKRNRPWLLERLATRRKALDSPVQWCAAVLAEADSASAAAELAHRAKMPVAQVSQVVAALTADRIAIDAGGGRVVHKDTVADLAGKIAEHLEGFHSANPLRLGVAPTDLPTELNVPESIIALAIEKLACDGAIERHGDLIALVGSAVKAPAADIELAGRVETVLGDAGLSPPSVTVLAETLGESAERIDAMIGLLADQSSVVRLDAKLVMHAAAVERAKETALDLFRSGASFTTMAFRDALGVSRKYAVPLLDYFDTIRFTARSGSLRRAGVEAKKRLAV